MEEFFDVVDDNNRVIGRAARSECHGNPDLAHRVVHVLVFNSAGQLYLQKRSMTKDIQPGFWDTSVGGHLMEGESYPDAAIREMKEELDIEGVELEELYGYVLRNSIETEFITTFRTVYDGEINPDPGEISEGRFFDLEKIESLMGTGYFSSNFEDEFNLYKEKYLK
ncbi:MAG: NUDIX domain-containing protein [Spirochaetes bacterium]|nr:NUDIX domain-containing protein [Spirochaetota bacterium]MBN2772274.1 NUDIX domain-containing protein [Spirochaetota bacterium]